MQGCEQRKLKREQNQDNKVDQYPNYIHPHMLQLVPSQQS